MTGSVTGASVSRDLLVAVPPQGRASPRASAKHLCDHQRAAVQQTRMAYWWSSGVTASETFGRPRVRCMQEPSGWREEAPPAYQLSLVQDAGG
jgi:hypothetical protein